MLPPNRRCLGLYVLLMLASCRADRASSHPCSAARFGLSPRINTAFVSEAIEIAKPLVAMDGYSLALTPSSGPASAPTKNKTLYVTAVGGVSHDSSKVAVQRRECILVFGGGFHSQFEMLFTFDDETASLTRRAEALALILLHEAGHHADSGPDLAYVTKLASSVGLHLDEDAAKYKEFRADLYASSLLKKGTSQTDNADALVSGIALSTLVTMAVWSVSMRQLLEHSPASDLVPDLYVTSSKGHPLWFLRLLVMEHFLGSQDTSLRRFMDLRDRWESESANDSWSPGHFEWRQAYPRTAPIKH